MNMHITGFLLFSIIFLIILCIFAIIERTNLFLENNKYYNSLNSKGSIAFWIRGGYLVLFAILASMAVSTMKSYIYPTDKSIFRNIDYHVLSHKGYEVGKKFFLANGYRSDNDGFPANSLWDSKDGEVLLDGDSGKFVIREYVDPIYIRKNSSYQLVNKVIEEDISDGFVLSQDNDTLFSLRIEAGKKDKVLYISTIYGSNHTYVTDTSSFNRVIYQGYPILDIIAKSPRIDLTEDIESWFEGAYLVRSEIPMNKNIPSFNESNPASLCLMPGLSFYQNEGLNINGVSHNFEQTFEIPFNDFENDGKITFFSGIGKNKTEEFRLSVFKEKMRLEFLKPDMKQIKDTLGCVFINSSVEDVSKETLGGGYLFNKFVLEENFNHINAHFQYTIDNARSELSINIVDLNRIEDNPSGYKCDKEFLLHSKNKTPDATSWIFEVKNLRETNDLSDTSILIFIIVMYIMIVVRIFLDSWFERSSLSLMELGVYVILFSLCFIRLILGWRASTFIPVEDISLPMYLKMRASIFNWSIWIVALLPLILTIGVGIWKRNNWHPFNIWSTSLKKDYFAWYTLGLFVILLLMCFILGQIPMFNRLCNIPIPLILFFILEIWMNHLEQNDIPQIKTCRIMAFFILFAYLFLVDAGFTIIFLAYMAIHYLVLGNLYRNNGKNKKNKLVNYSWIFSIISLIMLFIILYFEGDIMIYVFSNIGLFVTGFGMLCSLILLYFILKNETLNKWLKWGKILLLSFSIGFTILGFLDATEMYSTFTPTLNKKAHMRYRAEIQKLKGDEKIDDLIRKCDFDSDDIVFIMRSAHNQWFINQYIRAGQKMSENGEYFRIQPHSNQGATFTTQTTDLVVTRYLLAEHGEDVVKRILFLWLLLIVLFVFEFKMDDKVNRLFLSGPIMIYVISLMVYLSATNRIVFVGQDFPMISLQSKVAVLFPGILILLLLSRCIYIRSNERLNYKKESLKKISIGLMFAATLSIFTWVCMTTIEQKGKDQEDSQFNVSQLVSDLCAKVDEINERFSSFQEINANTLKQKSVKETWDAFTDGENTYNEKFYEYLNSEKSDFFSSLLKYFQDKQTSKTDVNQLLHLRRRNGICYLSVNKQHYFIPAIMHEENRWNGDIYSAKIDSEMMLFGHSQKKIKPNLKMSYEKNVFVSDIQMQVPDMPLMRFGKEWTPNNSPLYLVSAKQGQSHSIFFNIGTDTMDIVGDGQNNQIATAVHAGDILSLYKKKTTQKNATIVLNGHMTNDGTPYLVRNMWINGHKRLFYPLGKQSMWTYHLGQLISDVYSKDPALRDSTLYLSLDYGLYKAFYNSITKQINRKISPPKTFALIEVLKEFSEKEYTSQCDSRKNLYFDESTQSMVVKADVKDKTLTQAARLINKELRHFKHYEHPLSKALASALAMQYDFTAVAIDGDGHIRALFDYSKNRHVDPNNISHLNRTISELYQEGSNADERDIFGSKALQYLPVGPGSSFKPIAYTAITSQEKLNWTSITVSNEGRTQAEDHTLSRTASGSQPLAYYGGLKLPNKTTFNIAGSGGVSEQYLQRSDNLYHSVIILLGMQRQGRVEKILRDVNPDISSGQAFPKFSYNGKMMCFNPKNWYEEKKPNVIEEHDLLTDGLFFNFRINEYAPRLADSYSHLFGDNELIQKLFYDGKSNRGWVFPETSSINNADRNLDPLKVGFNQILLGADPLMLTPLQMAVNASRLASLNRSQNMVSLLDDAPKGDYEFFKVGPGWTEQGYLDFMKKLVWKQLRNVPKIGTARGLNSLVTEMEKGKYGRPYYLYCKTGTLNDDRSGAKGNRMKHLLVIITNKPLELVQSISELNQVKYYTLYLSYLGINQAEFNTSSFSTYIKDVLTSESFKNYMSKNHHNEN